MKVPHSISNALDRARQQDVAATPLPVVEKAWSTRRLLIGLMVPMGMTTLNMSMFGVALPSIRDSFQMEPDLVAWMTTAYTLPFVMFMPLYGRLGDGLGKRRLFTIGIAMFFLGTLMCLVAPSLAWLFVGRVVQGIGTAAVNPLCLAIIAELIPQNERGRALATWSSTGPATSMIGPFLGGVFISQWGWESIFWPGIIASAVALYFVRGHVPKLAPEPTPGFLRNFDWVGIALLSLSILSLIGYFSSRLITGIEPLLDWRLALLTLTSLGAFIWWEGRQPNPLMPLSIFRAGYFGRASVVAGIRMFLNSSESFLIPLYFSDIFGLNAQMLGMVITLHSGSLLLTVRLSGRIADRWTSRWPVVFGIAGQTAAMIYFAFLPGSTPLWFAVAGLVWHGLSAGLSLAVLPRIAMADVPQEQSGSAAGLYSTARFFGNILGTTLGGVVLQQAITRTETALDAYHFGFGFVVAVGVLGVLLAIGFRERSPKQIAT